jgi:glycine cleavage system transcriptional repressor
VSHYAVSAVGRDRPGIVAALAEGLLELGGNVEDSRMANLRGQFAVMLVVSLDDDGEGGRAALQQRLDPIRERLGLDALTVSEVSEPDGAGTSPSHMITVYGADHTGIVHAVSAELAERGVNITDLQTKLAGSSEKPLYAMMLEVEVDRDAITELRSALAAVGERASVEVSIAEIDAEPL